MKKIFLIACLIIFSGKIAFAQTDSTLNSSSKTPEERAEKHSQHFAKSLGLTADQTAKIKAIDLEHIKKIDELRTKYKNQTDKQAKGKEFKILDENTDAKYKAVLTPAQYEKYWQAKKERMEKKKEKHDLKKKKNIK